MNLIHLINQNMLKWGGWGLAWGGARGWGWTGLGTPTLIKLIFKLFKLDFY